MSKTKKNQKIEKDNITEEQEKTNTKNDKILD